MRDGESGQAGHRVGDFGRGHDHVQLGQLHGVPLRIAPDKRISQMLQMVLQDGKKKVK